MTVENFREEKTIAAQNLKTYRDLKNCIETVRTEERTAMAKKCKEAGIDVEIIIRVTGFSKEEIKNLK